MNNGMMLCQASLIMTRHCLRVCCAAAMWAMILTTIVQFRGVIGNLAVVLLGPYLVWVSYASALTIWIWQHNTPTVARKVSLKWSETVWCTIQMRRWNMQWGTALLGGTSARLADELTG